MPFGTYNVTNTGSVTTREVVALIRQRLLPDHAFDFFESEEEFLRIAAQTPRSNCVMDNSKLRATGVPISEVHDAVERALAAWRSA